MYHLKSSSGQFLSKCVISIGSKALIHPCIADTKLYRTPLHFTSPYLLSFLTIVGWLTLRTLAMALVDL